MSVYRAIGPLDATSVCLLGCFFVNLFVSCFFLNIHIFIHFNVFSNKTKQRKESMINVNVYLHVATTLIMHV